MLGALISLMMPMHLYAVDHNGRSLACGSALQADYVAVGAEDQLNQQRHNRDRDMFQLSNYTSECARRSTSKEHLALGIAAFGAVTLTAALFPMRPIRHRRRIAPTDLGRARRGPRVWLRTGIQSAASDTPSRAATPIPLVSGSAPSG
jgi:hypothetical protein